MKTIKMFILSTLLMMSTATLADSYSMPPTKTYEAMIKSVRLPSNPNGTLAVRECRDCDYERYRVTPRTRYRIDNKNMRLADFRAMLEKLGLDRDHNVNVTRDIQSNTITAVYLSTQ